MKNNKSIDMQKKRATLLMKQLRKASKKLPPTMGELIKKQYHNNPFLILISCLLSLRTRDVVTYPVCVQLFSIAKTPQEFIALPLPQLEKIIHSLGFYKTKAKTLKSVSRDIISRFKGKVPKTEEELRSIKGVGPKTANMVLGVAYSIPAICVDTHVHRLSNSLGIVQTKRPEQTEAALECVIPKKMWIEYSKLMVSCGQNMHICRPFIEEFIPPKKRRNSAQ